jgi:hypothetical protein
MASATALALAQGFKDARECPQHRLVAAHSCRRMGMAEQSEAGPVSEADLAAPAEAFPQEHRRCRYTGGGREWQPCGGEDERRDNAGLAVPGRTRCKGAASAIPVSETLRYVQRTSRSVILPDDCPSERCSWRGAVIFALVWCPYAPSCGTSQGTSGLPAARAGSNPRPREPSPPASSGPMTRKPRRSARPTAVPARSPRRRRTTLRRRRRPRRGGAWAAIPLRSRHAPRAARPVAPGQAASMAVTCWNTSSALPSRRYP